MFAIWFPLCRNISLAFPFQSLLIYITSLKFQIPTEQFLSGITSEELVMHVASTASNISKWRLVCEAGDTRKQSTQINGIWVWVESQHEDTNTNYTLGDRLSRQGTKPSVFDDLLLSIGNYIPFIRASSNLQRGAVSGLRYEASGHEARGTAEGPLEHIFMNATEAKL
jgi:hypothetical protein